MVKRRKDRASKIPLLLTVTIVFIIAIVVLPKVYGEAAVKYAAIGKPAPNFTLTSLDGKKVSLNELKGRPIILNFWATWCPPCKLEMPALDKVYGKSSEKGFTMLTINQQEDVGTIQKFLKENGYSLPVVLDSSGEVGELYQVQGIPTTVFIDSKGVITDIHTGTMPVEDLFLSKIKY
ncbi:MAG TPA: TlpA disulfide reductase family protein [Candidatus Deferrimicrobium sp.]|nr:TlpA disulfide reductase family protein [Candidatus Deferrimicrobium sp.]